MLYTIIQLYTEPNKMKYEIIEISLNYLPNDHDSNKNAIAYNVKELEYQTLKPTQRSKLGLENNNNTLTQHTTKKN